MFCHLKRLIVPILLIVIGCGHEKSVEPRVVKPVDTTGTGGSAGGTAEYAFVTSPGTCSDATAGGDFEAGKVLGTDAKITVTVNVTKTGNWTLSTNTVNSFTFIGAGTFTATGSQTITLYGIGTPAAAGLNTFSVKGCSVVVAVIPGTSDNGSATDYYYKIVIDGKTYEQTVTTSNDYEAGSGLSGGDDVTISASIDYYVIGQDQVPKGKTGFGVTRGTMHNYTHATNGDFKAFFAPGTYTIRKSFADGDGVTLDWLDADGVTWSTSFGTGDQTGSTFQIISITDATDFTGTLYLKTKMQFKCKLYNETTGEMKQVTSGEMVGNFGKI